MKRIAYLILLIALPFRASASEDMFPEWQELEEPRREWYAKFLAAAGEEPVSITAGTDAYRFTWLRSFHNPVVIRIECETGCTLQARRLSGAGGYEPGEIAERVKRTLSATERDTFTHLFSAIDFWAGQPPGPSLGMDGARWILEASSDNKYRAWDAWSPAYDTRLEAFQSLCKFIIGLSGMQIPDDEIY